MKCQQCGTNEATHYCSGCGKWICDGPACAMKSAAESLLRNPSGAIAAAPAAVARAAGNAASGIANLVAEALSFKP